MKYSIIIPYRDRAEHLSVLLPALTRKFAGEDYEIIVVEQEDNNKFRRGNCRNVGALAATGDVLIFHDVDYYPAGEVDVPVQYVNNSVKLFLPVKRVEFVYNDLKPKPLHEVPGGYRHFKISVDDDFYGGVLAFQYDSFFAINGFSWKFIGWGFEDADLRERVKYYGISTSRSEENLWYALDHVDSGPPITDPDFQNNINMWRHWKTFLSFGLTDMPYKSRVVESPVVGVTKWIMATAFNDPKNKVVVSTFNFDEGDE